MEKLLGQLNESQQNAVVYNDGPSLVIAGAGSGKTRVLTYKIAYLLKNGIAPYNILALTFTNKAAREMKDRIARLVDEETAHRLWMGTFHSVFSKILRREADKFGYKADYTIYDAQDSKNLIKSIIKEMGLDDKTYKPANIQARISQAKNALITPDIYESSYDITTEDNHSRRPHTRDIYKVYWNRCRASGVLDFDDLLLYTYLLFKNNPEVLERYRNWFRFILVDEYQDTNSVQHEIVRQLAADHHRVCVVGDDAQSIYSFRGANIGNILNFRKTFPETKLFKLEQNYRSTQTIVNAANSLIKNNKQQIPKTIFSKNPIGEKISLISAYSDFEEGYNVASRIAEMRMLNKFEYSDFAILYRTNAQSRIFEESLRKINIPYRIYGGLSFYQRKEVKDVIAYMRVVVNPNDEEAFKRIVNYPTRGIGDTTVGKIISTATTHGVSLWAVISNPLQYNLPVNSGAASKLKKFHDLISRFILANETQNAYEVGGEIIRETGLLTDLYTDKTPEGLSRVQNVEELLNSLYEFVSTRMEEGVENLKLIDFLAEVSLLTDQDTDKNENTNRVTMMTVHAAKGLEFRNVFIVGLEENLFPSEMCKTPQDIEEERRLFYVAITRAEENVILTYAKSRFRNGSSNMCSPSRFIGNIDRQYLAMPNNQWVETTSFCHRLPPNVVSRVGGNDSSLRRQTIGNLGVGDTIRHERFGKGKVTELTGEGDNAKATVEFDSFGRK
ncbi:MAG: UvrD-helicase domain-containing protein, partial [Dysgonamonadaceae bacterium]|nr:UvrD-helicase domain-containing protein [Dysgonamonadaceae bacterium]